MFGRVFGGATAYPRAKGIWRDDERDAALVKDEPVVVHCYTTPADIEDSRNLAELGRFCRTMGRDARETRFRVPAGGGRATDPEWTERRLVQLTPRTLKRLEAITEGVKARSGVNLEPMQLAALLLEKTTEQLNEDEVKDLHCSG